MVVCGFIVIRFCEGAWNEERERDELDHLLNPLRLMFPSPLPPCFLSLFLSPSLSLFVSCLLGLVFLFVGLLVLSFFFFFFFFLFFFFFFFFCFS